MMFMDEQNPGYKNPKTQPKKKEEPRMDPDLPRDNVYNRETARKLGWRFNRRLGQYVDADGCPVADSFGQPF